MLIKEVIAKKKIELSNANDMHDRNLASNIVNKIDLLVYVPESLGAPPHPTRIDATISITQSMETSFFISYI